MLNGTVRTASVKSQHDSAVLKVLIAPYPALTMGTLAPPRHRDACASMFEPRLMTLRNRHLNGLRWIVRVPRAATTLMEAHRAKEALHNRGCR